MVLISLVTSGCGMLGSAGERGATPTTTSTIAVNDDERLCSMLELPLHHVGPGHPSFGDVAVHDVADENAVGAMLTLSILSSPGSMGRFAPILEFLSRRSQVLLDPKHAKSEVPTLTTAIERNARELDRFLADGGCG